MGYAGGGRNKNEGKGQIDIKTLLYTEEGTIEVIKIWGEFEKERRGFRERNGEVREDMSFSSHKSFHKCQFCIPRIIELGCICVINQSINQPMVMLASVNMLGRVIFSDAVVLEVSRGLLCRAKAFAI